MMTIAQVYPQWAYAGYGVTSAPTGRGHTEGRERDNLLKLIDMFDVATIFEIGTFTGSTAVFLTQAPSVEHIWTLDLECGTVPSLPILKDDNIYLDVDKVEFPANVEQLRGDSATFDFSLWHGKCDMVFVMGAHSPEYMQNDMSAATRLVSSDGIIVLHAGTRKAWQNHRPAGYDYIQIGDRMGLVTQ